MNTITVLTLANQLKDFAFFNIFNGWKPFYKNETTSQYYTEEGDVVTVIVTTSLDEQHILVTINEDDVSTVLRDITVDISGLND